MGSLSIIDQLTEKGRLQPLSDAESRALERAIYRESSRQGTRRKPWRQKDDRMLKRLTRKGMTAREVAKEMGRTPFAIRTRIKRLKQREVTT